MSGTYYEKIARINLTTGEIKVEQLDPELTHEFIGGRGLGTKILYDEGVATADPLSSENKLLCVTGPLTGAVAPSSGRYTLVTKSPVTGKIAASNSGGIWGAKLKYAGWDAVIIEGEAREWTYISIEDSSIRLHDACEYIGSMTTELDEMLKAKHGADSSVLSIGPAGDNKSLLAAIMNDKIRAAGRGGIGAVMGAKKLKAIVVRTSRPHLDIIADPNALKSSTRRALNLIKKTNTSEIGLHSLDANAVDRIINCVGSLPARGWYSSVPEQDKQQLSMPGGCYRCPIACNRAGKTDHKPQQQGSNNRNIFDQCSMLCNEYGLDTIGVHRTIAAAVELYQRGAIKETECTGIPLEWNTLVEWAKRIGNPESELDRLMSSGAEHLCQHYGMPEIAREKKTLSTQKGLSAKKAGSSQRSNYTAEDEKAFRDLTAVIDSLGQCLFPSSSLGAQEYADLLNATVGTTRTAAQVLELGDRINSIEHMFNEMSCVCINSLGASPDI